MENTTEILRQLAERIKEAKTQIVEGRQIVVDSCKELYNNIEEGLYNKYGQDAVNDAYNDLCNGNFAEPFMCEKKKAKFELYSTIYINQI